MTLPRWQVTPFQPLCVTPVTKGRIVLNLLGNNPSLH